MLMEVRKNIKLIFLCFKYNLLRAMDNRISFFGKVFGMILNNAIMIVQWVVLFSLKDNIGGYGFKDVVLLWAFASETFGISRAFFGNAFDLSQLIYMGKLDAFLVQPKDTLTYVSVSNSSISALGDILYGYILLIILKASPLTWLLFTILSICGGLILTAVSVIWHSLSFRFQNAEDVATIVNNNMINLGTYPNGIFTPEIKWLLLTLLPVSLTIHFPIEIVKSFDIKLFLVILGATLFFIIFAFIIFRKGLKKYSSSNLVSARI